jgi:hypothetical protein
MSEEERMMEVAPAAPSLEQTPSLERTVTSAETELVEVRDALERAKSELERLTRLQHHQLGPFYDRLDQLDLLIAEAQTAGRPPHGRHGKPPLDALTDELPEPEPPPSIEDYNSSLRFVDPAPEEADGARGQASDASSAVRRVFRDLARRAHPDLAQDPAEKERRTAFIARVNEAYRRADLYELQRLAEEWAVIGAEGPAPGSAERDPWLRRRLIWLRARIAEARVERETVLSSPLGRALAEFGSEQALEVLRSHLWEQVKVKERELQTLYAGEAALPQPSSPAPAAQELASPPQQIKRGFFG